jgi:hypothetical protein
VRSPTPFNLLLPGAEDWLRVAGSGASGKRHPRHHMPAAHALVAGGSDLHATAMPATEMPGQEPQGLLSDL